MNSIIRTTALAAATVIAATGAQAADLTVGFVTSLSGPGASIGIPYGRGIAAAYEYASTVNGQKIKLIQLDDGADPSAATRNARKLIEEEKVDVLIGTATAPSTIAMVAVANELKVPMIAISPITVPPTATGDRWGIAVPQPPSLMVKVVADRMTRDGVKNVGYIGFSDAWGDLVYSGAKSAEAAGGIKVLTNERYSRTDTSVTGQILKIVAAKPDAVLIGGSATQGALPLLSLAERGFKGKLYGTPALLNPDFIRVGGKAAEGILVSAGPVIVAEQLPDTHFSKKISLAFRAAHLKAAGVASDRRLLRLQLRRLAHPPRRGQARDGNGAARYARVPHRAQGRDVLDQGPQRHARHLQFQGRRKLRRGRARPGAGAARQRDVEIRAVSPWFRRPYERAAK